MKVKPHAKMRSRGVLWMVRKYSPRLSALASLGLVASPWVAPTLKGRLRASA